jgi:dienelactone hydrolase
MQRDDVTFESGGARCAAWLYRPEGSEGRVPCVVMAHGFSAVREARLDAYAERFAQAGMAALVFDYRHFGASGGEPRQLLDIRRQLDDYRAAIAFARGLDGIDPERVAAWGTSFSGGHVQAIAAEDHRLAAVVAQVPYADGLVNLPHLGKRLLLRLTAEGLRDQAGALLGRSPRTVPAVGPPGSVAVMTQPDAESGFRAITPPGSTWRNEVAARIALHGGTYRPGTKSKRIRCPILYCIADHDSVTPIAPALKAAAAAPRSEVKRYPAGHFDPYVGDLFELVVADQIEFLTRHLQPAGAPAAKSTTEASA